MDTQTGFVIANEFAHVRVGMVSTSERDWIDISAPVRERSVRLEAKALWILAGLPSEVFSDLLSDAPLGIKEA